MHWDTTLIHPKAKAPEGFRSLVTPIYRGSTVLFERQADVVDDWRQTERGYSYGVYGSPTVLELGARIAEIERARHTFVVPGGQAAIALIYLAFCRSGSHALVPETAYGPNRAMGDGLLRNFGVEVESYDPLIGSGIASLIRHNTSLIWTESPGSITMEVQDVPAIVAAAHAKNVTVALDNTYAAGIYFDAFAAGVDVSMQALTKYVGGHSDLLLGSVSVRDDERYNALGSVFQQLGLAVGPDDAGLALRGLQTLSVRLERLQKSALEIALWLQRRPEIELVLHPALASCPGHEVWKRDFTGSSSVFSAVFNADYSRKQVEDFADNLQLFKTGHSWGGVTSLICTYPNLKRDGKDYAGRIARINVGLENVEDLIEDLERSFTCHLHAKL